MGNNDLKGEDKMSGDFFKSLGKSGKAKVRRILTAEYQKYLIGCLKTGEKGLPYELWLKKRWRKGE